MNPPLYGQVVQPEPHNHRLLEQRRWLLEERRLLRENRAGRPRSRLRAALGSLVGPLRADHARRTKSIETGTPSSPNRSRNVFSTQ